MRRFRADMLDRNAKVFLVCSLVLGAGVIGSHLSIRLPGNDQGHEPSQPIAYSHRLHAGELAINCLYCHFGAAQSAVAGVPPTSVCMNCHRVVSSGKNAADAEKLAAIAEKREPKRIVSPEISKLYRAFALDDDLRPIPQAESRPIKWSRVNTLPHHVAFDHRAHVSRGVACQACHGPVETMDRVRQEASFTMGWCVECHRTNTRDGRGALSAASGHPRIDDHVSVDCAVCHH